MCSHDALMVECLESVVPETGAPIYAPTTPEQFDAIVEHALVCH